jgi:hypothetical protein
MAPGRIRASAAWSSARTLLGDPARDEVWILVIALDSGFASIAPFHRG